MTQYMTSPSTWVLLAKGIMQIWSFSNCCSCSSSLYDHFASPKRSLFSKSNGTSNGTPHTSASDCTPKTGIRQKHLHDQLLFEPNIHSGNQSEGIATPHPTDPSWSESISWMSTITQNPTTNSIGRADNLQLLRVSSEIENISYFA